MFILIFNSCPRGLVVSQCYFCCLLCKITSVIVKLIKDRMNGLTILLNFFFLKTSVTCYFFTAMLSDNYTKKPLTKKLIIYC